MSRMPSKKALFLQEVAELVKDSYPLNVNKLSILLDQYKEIKQRYGKRITGKHSNAFESELLAWHMKHYADTVQADKSQLAYISRFMDYKRRIVEMLIDTHNIHVGTPFVSFDFCIVGYLRKRWEQSYPELDKQNRLLYAAVRAHRVGVDIPITSVDAELPLLEMAAVDNGKLEDVYGVYANGCIGARKNELSRTRKRAKA